MLLAYAVPALIWTVAIVLAIVPLFIHSTWHIKVSLWVASLIGILAGIVCTLAISVALSQGTVEIFPSEIIYWMACSFGAMLFIGLVAYFRLKLYTSAPAWGNTKLDALGVKNQTNSKS